jgi:amino acid adenylation domain-containing protein
MEERSTWPSLASGFWRSCEEFPQRPALEVGGAVLTYRELQDRAAAIARAVEQAAQSDPRLLGVFAYRSATSFAGVLGALIAGWGYVPLNRTFPPARTRFMLEASGCRALVADRESAQQLAEILTGKEEPLLIILPEHGSAAEFAARWPQHKFLFAADLIAGSRTLTPRPVAANSIAYLLFTSGSTGTPKGVMVSHSNVRHFVDSVVRRYSITERDRLSQTFDLTFDLSAFDMFVAWERGACLCCPSQKALIHPGQFINEARLSVWFSVPSVGGFMQRLGMLKAGRYPSLRLSLFCGEPLSLELARQWALAAPNSTVENLYGPTELTIACTAFACRNLELLSDGELGLVPIGWPLPGMHAYIADESLCEVPPGAPGELLLGGPQVSLGYWHDAEKTAAAFVVPPGKNEIYYRTGDRVRRPVGDEPLRYLGRTDHQLKVLGHRVELGEVEAALRQAAGVESAVAIGWPFTASGPAGIVAFLAGANLNAHAIREKLRRQLPVYAVPREIRVLPELPLNANGKIDRNALARSLETSA